MTLRWFKYDEDTPQRFVACFHHKGRPYIGEWEIEGDPEVYEEIEDALARCWDMAWGRVVEAGNE